MQLIKLYSLKNENQDECNYLMDTYNKHGIIDALHRINLFNLCCMNPIFNNLKELVYYNVPCLVDSNNEGPSDFLRSNGNSLALASMFELVQGFDMTYKGRKKFLDLPINN